MTVRMCVATLGALALLTSPGISPPAAAAGSDFAIEVAANGDVGLGTPTPLSALHLKDTTANNQVVRLEANNGRRWLFGLTSINDEFIINGLTKPGAEFRVDANGNVTIPGGAMYNGSDRNRKSRIVPLDGRETLERLAELPISTWVYSHNETERHLGPMAQDFHAAFGLGKDNVTIAPLDASGVAMAAIQGLHEMVREVVQEKDEALEALRRENAELAARVAALEGGAREASP